MAGNQIAQLFVALGLDSSGLQAGLTSAQSTITGAGKAMTAIGTAITASLSGAIYSFTSTGASLEELSEKTGMSVTALSELSFAAQMTGADTSNLQTSIKGMQVAITDMSGKSANAQKAIAGIGLNLQDLQAMTPDQQFNAIADAIANVQDPTERTADAVAIFGKAGTNLLPMLANGAAGLQSLEAQAVATGDVMTQQGATSAVGFSQALTTLKSSAAGVAMTIGETLVPILTPLVNDIAKVVEKVTAWMQAHPELTKTILIVVGAVGALMVVLGPLLIALPMIAAGVTMLLGPVGLVVLAVAAFAAIAAVVMLNRGKIKDFFADIWNGLVSGFKTAINFLIGLAEGWANGYISAVNFIINALDKIQLHIPSIDILGIHTPSIDVGINIPDVPLVALPRLGAGGIAMSPTLAMVGDNPAGEAIIPLDKLKTGNTVNIYPGMVISNRDLLNFIQEGLLITNRSNSTLGFTS